MTTASSGGRDMPRTPRPTGYERQDSDDARDRAADASARFPDDQLCRDHGFRLIGRPEGHPAIWTRGGKEFLQPEAVSIARAEQKRQKDRRDAMAREATGGL